MSISTLILSIILYAVILALTYSKPNIFGSKLYIVGIIRAAVGIGTGLLHLFNKTTSILMFISLVLHICCGVYMCLYYDSAYKQEIKSGGHSSKKKGVAILYAFLLGGLGIHKFYTNKRTAGAFYLLFSVTGIPIILGYIDGFRLIPQKKERIFGVEEKEDHIVKTVENRTIQTQEKKEKKQSTLSIKGSNNYAGVWANGNDIDNCEIHVQFDDRQEGYTCFVEEGVITRIKGPKNYYIELEHK